MKPECYRKCGSEHGLENAFKIFKINKSNMVYKKSYDKVWKFHGNTSKKTGSSKLSLNIYKSSSNQTELQEKLISKARLSKCVLL